MTNAGLLRFRFRDDALRCVSTIGAHPTCGWRAAMHTTSPPPSKSSVAANRKVVDGASPLLALHDDTRHSASAAERAAARAAAARQLERENAHHETLRRTKERCQVFVGGIDPQEGAANEEQLREHVTVYTLFDSIRQNVKVGPVSLCSCYV